MANETMRKFAEFIRVIFETADEDEMKMQALAAEGINLRNQKIEELEKKYGQLDDVKSGFSTGKYKIKTLPVSGTRRKGGRGTGVQGDGELPRELIEDDADDGIVR